MQAWLKTSVEKVDHESKKEHFGIVVFETVDRLEEESDSEFKVKSIA